MKSLFLLLAFGASTLKVYPQLIAEYRFDAPCVINCSTPTDCVGAGTPNAFFVNATALTSAGPCNLGAGISGVGIGSCGSMNGFAVGQPANPNRARWADSWSTGALTLNDHFSIVLSAQPVTIVFIDSVKWRELRSNTGPVNRQLRTSADGFGNAVWTGTNAGTTWITQRVTSGLPSFTSATPLDIRIYGYGSGGNAGSMRIDSLRVYAHTFSTLPVELLSFTGKAVDQDVELAWTTASELNNDHFEVIRSDDGQAWYEVGRIPGSGTTTIPRDYGFLDISPSVGTNYYKLRQVDVGGDYVDSHTISVDVGEQQWFRRVGDQIICDKPTMLFDALGQLISGPSHEHRIDRAGVLILQQEDRARSTRLVR